MRRALVTGLLVAAVAALAAPGAAAPVKAPTVGLMVVGRHQTLYSPHTVKLTATTVRIGHRNCPVPAGTALGGLAATHLKLHVADVAGCDPTQLFVTKVGADANRGAAGWEYKVNKTSPSTGAGDPAGRIHGNGANVLWFWCTSANACQRTLAVTVKFRGGTTAVFHVVGYDDNGHGTAVAGATIHVGPKMTLTTSSGGSASAKLALGKYSVYATKTGLVRSFPITVGIVS